MTYMHTQIVHWDNLSNEQINWLIKNDECFVLISEGDSSIQYDFDIIPLTFEEVLEDCSLDEEIVLCEKPKEIPVGFYLSKSYWGDFMLIKETK